MKTYLIASILVFVLVFFCSCQPEREAAENIPVKYASRLPSEIDSSDSSGEEGSQADSAVKTETGNSSIPSGTSTPSGLSVKGASGSPAASSAGLAAASQRKYKTGREDENFKPVITDASRKFVRNNNEFAIDMYRKIASQSKGNLFFSPLGVSMSMGMTYGGARGETAGQMEKVLHFESRQDIHGEFLTFSRLIRSKRNKDTSRFQIANRLWGTDKFSFRPAFLKLTEENYGSRLREIDFTNPEKARLIINSWVEGETREKIKNLIPQGLLNGGMRLVLTNAVYFKNDWENRFDKSAAKKGAFTVSPGRKVNIPFMFRQGEYKFAQFNGFKGLEIPYRDKMFSMIILLPDNADGIKKLDESLNIADINRWFAKLSPQTVRVTIPSFKMFWDADLSDTFKSLGLIDAFDKNANFSKMTGKRDLILSKILHKAFIEVNEDGTEASAATAVIMKPMGKPAVKDFTADHPFIFMIKENRTGSIFFMGKVVSPTQ